MIRVVIDCFMLCLVKYVNFMCMFSVSCFMSCFSLVSCLLAWALYVKLKSLMSSHFILYSPFPSRFRPWLPPCWWIPAIVIVCPTPDWFHLFSPASCISSPCLPLSCASWSCSDSLVKRYSQVFGFDLSLWFLILQVSVFCCTLILVVSDFVLIAFCQ